MDWDKYSWSVHFCRRRSRKGYSTVAKSSSFYLLVCVVSFRAYSLTLFIGLDYPYVTSLLTNNTIEIHSVETQEIVQVIGAPVLSPATTPKITSPVRKNTAHSRSSSTVTTGNVDSSERLNLVASIGGHLVPSTQRLDKLRTVPVRLLRT